MCIRDSHILEIDAAAPGRWRQALALLSDWHDKPAQGHLIAVSYTHLRAHETVLDLVCRLLLEKKKDTHAHLKQCTETT